MQKIIKKLQVLGLNDKEALLYTTLLELGQGTILDISKKSEIKRSTVYEILPQLQNKGLVSLGVRKKRKIYYPEDPAKVLSLVEQQYTIAKELLPELEAMNNFSSSKPKIMYFQGTDGLIAMYNEILNTAQEIRAFVTTDIFNNKKLEEYIWDVFTPQRLKNKCMLYSIGPDSEWMRQTYQGDQDKYLRKVKLVSQETYPFSVETLVYGRHIAVISFEHSLGIIIESKDIHSTWKQIHSLCWNLIK